MEIVSFQNNEIHKTLQTGRIETILNSEPGTRQGDGEQPRIWFEHLVQFVQQQLQIQLVHRLSAELFGAQILKVEVQAVEVVSPEDRYDRVDEVSALRGTGDGATEAIGVVHAITTD